MTFAQFQTVEAIADRFLSLLSSLDIQPPLGSSLETELLSPTRLMEIFKALPSGEQENESILRDAVGIYDLAAKLLSIQKIDEFKEQFVPHLKLIANARPASASLGQNSKSNYDDGTSRKIAELYLACLVAHFGTNVKLDDPKASSNGRNPDVLFDFSGFAPIAHPAQQWALAVKTISSQQGQTIFDQIKGGAKQIDDSRCSASRGIVVINTKDALDHGALWQGTYRDAAHALSVLRAQLEGLTQKAMLNRDQSEWDSLFVGKVARPVLFLGQSLVRLRTLKSQLTPTPLRMLCCFEPVVNNGISNPIGLDIAESMNHLMQTIGWFST